MTTATTTTARARSTRKSTTRKTTARPRKSAEERAAAQQESLDRATGSFSAYNYDPIYNGFAAKGIPESDILPRENIFTYNAWRALGRQVMKGEKGVAITVWIPVRNKKNDAGTESSADKKQEYTIPRHSTVFHISQTQPIHDPEAEADQAASVAACEALERRNALIDAAPEQTEEQTAE